MSVTLTALAFAEQLAQKYISEARDTADKSSLRCEKLLYASKEAILGLYNEPVQIIIEAKYCDFSKHEEIEIVKRIDSYLDLARLRPILSEALEGLDVYLTELSRDRYFYINLFKGRGDVSEETISRFEELLKKLKEYYTHLDREALTHRIAGTGLFINQLAIIKDYLLRNDTSWISNENLNHEIAQQQQKLYEYVESISRTTHQIILLYSKA